MKTAHSLAFACAVVLGIPSHSFALGIRIADQDARATARGNAFTATADNPSAIYYNAAGITQLYQDSLSQPVTLSLGGKGVATPQSTADTGVQVRAGVYAISLESKFSPANGGASFDSKHTTQAAASFYATWKPTAAPIVFGLGIYSPYGFGLQYGDDASFRNLALSGSVQYLTIHPVIAWQATSSLSLAAGPTFNYGKVNLKQGILSRHDFFQFDGEGWAVGWTASAMWRPHAMHSFGLTYRSQTDIEFDGDARTSYHSFDVATPFGPFKIPGQDTNERASAGIKFPQNVVLGYSFRPTDRWNFEVNVDWTDWDNLNDVNLRKKSGDVRLPFQWQSSLFYEFGASYRFDSGLTASLGYIYSENSVPNATFNPIVPDSNRHILSAGLGGKWRNWNYDLAYQYAHGPERTVANGTSADGAYKFDSHALSLSLGTRF